MKAFIAALALMVSGLASADSAKFQVSTFKGELKIEKTDIKIQSITLVARLQFCNFWGTTCAGGPSSSEETALQFKQDSATNLVVIKNSTAMNVSAIKVGNRFSSCNLKMAITGVGADGVKYDGHLTLIHENDKDVCSSPSEIQSIIAEKLKVPASINMMRRF